MISHPAFKALPNLGQFAKNGVWEDAWAFPQHTLPSHAQISDYLAGTTEIAFEAFFGDAFFGARFHGGAQDVAQFASSCVNAMCAAADGASFFSHISQSIFLDGFGEEITFSEVGAVNSWQSVGPIKIGSPQEALQDFDALWTTLTAAPLASNASHGKAVEFAGLSPIYHWFALPISSTEPPFALNRDLLYKALQSAQ
jgi:hypothetical protein